MNNAKYWISLGFQNTESSASLKVKKGDTCRKIYISLTDCGMPYHISEGCHAAFTAEKPDGNKVYADCAIDECTIIYDMNDTPQLSAVTGVVECEIKLYGADGNLLTTPKFKIIVVDTVYEEGDEVETPIRPTRVLMAPYPAAVGQFLQVEEVSEDGTAVKLKAVNAVGGGSSAKIANVTLRASAWGGTASPYSQVVQISGVTENSQVDLTPSVEQLAIFHDKDLAFVAENEDGVVTVYALGDKPTNDYTMQVTITEVYV